MSEGRLYRSLSNQEAVNQEFDDQGMVNPTDWKDVIKPELSLINTRIIIEEYGGVFKFLIESTEESEKDVELSEKFIAESDSLARIELLQQMSLSGGCVLVASLSRKADIEINHTLSRYAKMIAGEEVRFSHLKEKKVRDSSKRADFNPRNQK